MLKNEEIIILKVMTGEDTDHEDSTAGANFYVINLIVRLKLFMFHHTL